MKQKNIAMQDMFLNELRKERMQVTIHLVNGFQIKGYIHGYDSFIILIESEGRQTVIYKHAISTITPAKAISLADYYENKEA